MRAKSMVLLMLALGCGVVASIGITQVMAKRGGATTTAQAEVEGIFVAMKDLPIGDPISAQMVKLEEWPKDKVPNGALTKLEEVENRRPKTRIFAGSPILENQLLGKGVLDQGASDVIPKGFRVVAVKADAISTGGSLIRPGDRVDVLVHVRYAGGDLTRTATKTILQDVKVFAVNEVWDVATTSGEKAITARTVSLLVTPAQAEKITLASEMGNVRLVMRSPEDKEQADVAGARAHDVLGMEMGGQDRQVAPILSASMQPETPKPNPVAGLLGLLGAARPQKSEPDPGAAKDAPQVKPPEVKPPGVNPPETFTMRIMIGSQVNDIVLESTGDNKSAGTDTSFFDWRVSSSASPAASAGATPTSAADRPAASPAATSPADEPADEDDEEPADEEPETKSVED